MDSKDNLNVSVYDRKTRAMLEDVVDSKVKQMWFDNYRKNKKLIEQMYKITDVPTLTKAICVGAGPTLKKNLHELEGVEAPVLVCDKSAGDVARYVKPFAVLALNTDHTDVKKWLNKFDFVMKTKGWSYDDVWLIVPVTVNPEIFQAWEGNKIAFMNPANTCPEFTALVEREQEMPPTIRGDNVGFFSVITAYSLGADQVVMLGMNYCYESREKALEATRGYSYVYIHDLNDDEVYTTLDWIDARSEFIGFCMETMHHTTYINCSEGGILYQAGVIAAMDFGIWNRFIEQRREECDATEGTKKGDGR